jgi:glycosyltransferase involved in cell wall biosynthesis
MSSWLLATGDVTTDGGMDRANHALASFLARQGHPVHLVAHRIAPDLASMPTVRSHMVLRPFGANLLGAPLLAHAAASRLRALGSSTRALMNGGNGALGTPTWVHYLHAAYTPHVAASIRTRLSAAAGRRYYLAREKAALTTSPLVICNSDRTSSDVRRHYGIPASRIKVIYYGSDPQAFGPVSADARHEARRALEVADGRRIALFIGALGDRRKGFDVLFEAWAALTADPAWDVDLLVAGVGGEAEAWSARAHASGTARAMRFLGFRTDISTVLAAADVLVHPARYEAYGLGVHEAICRGVPAIVTAGAGVTERYPKSLSSLIVDDPLVPSTLVTALRAWRANADAWRFRVADAAAALRGRSWDDMAAEIAGAVEAAAA